MEYARNVLGWEFAHTYEVVKDETYDREENGTRNENDSRKFVVSLFFFRNVSLESTEYGILLLILITKYILIQVYTEHS